MTSSFVISNAISRMSCPKRAFRFRSTNDSSKNFDRLRLNDESVKNWRIRSLNEDYDAKKESAKNALRNKSRGRERVCVSFFDDEDRPRSFVSVRSTSASSSANDSDEDKGEDFEGEKKRTANKSCSLKFLKEIKEKMDDPLAESTTQALLVVSLIVIAVVLYMLSGLGSLKATTDVSVAVELVKRALAKTGFTAAFALIFISELGDKTFFIAALLAMRMGRAPVIVGATSALGLMSVISVIIGRVFSAVPASFSNTIPIGEYVAVLSLLFFGLKSLKDANDMPKKVSTNNNGTMTTMNNNVDGNGVVIEGALAEAAEDVCKVESKISNQKDGYFRNIIETFCLIFVAEWGDRSMLATIALGAAQNPVGVAVGATAGHLFATIIAVIGGSLISKKISERFVAFCGGWLFLAFALFTALGIF
jgi:putative Ca2+/H+ antiporter (TMEM165/GDT1 family)